MKDFYNEFFKIPEDGRIQEKVMVTRLATTVVSIVLCLLIMSFTAYSYFSYNVTSSQNTIKTAAFNINVSIEPDTANANPPSNNINSYSIELAANTEYKFTVSFAEENTSKTGFCVISAIGCDDVYYTQQIASDIDNIPDSMCFYITPSNSTVITIKANWGTCYLFGDDNYNNEFYIEHDEHVVLDIMESDDNNETTIEVKK